LLKTLFGVKVALIFSIAGLVYLGSLLLEISLNDLLSLIVTKLKQDWQEWQNLLGQEGCISSEYGRFLA